VPPSIKQTLLALSALAAIAVARPATAQAPLATGQTVLAAYVPAQAHVDLPTYIEFRPNETTSSAVIRMSSIVYPNDCPRVRLMIACPEDNSLNITWDGGRWGNATGIPGRLSRVFQPFALGDAFTPQLSGSPVFKLGEARAAGATIHLVWKLEWVD
jgi:hypothetical protein